MNSMNQILVGLGGTGGKVLKAFKQKILQEFPEQSVRDRLPVGYVYVDSNRDIMNRGFNRSCAAEPDVSLCEAEFVDIGSLDLNEVLLHLESYPCLKGVVTDSEIAALGIIPACGTNQKRRIGRIRFALCANLYLSALRTQCYNAMKKSCLHQNHIHIITSLAGGTGSGALIDVLSQTRSHYPDAQITVHAILPEKYVPLGHDAGYYQANGYAALLELNALQALRFKPVDVTGEHELVDFHGRENKIIGIADRVFLYSNMKEDGSMLESDKELFSLVADSIYTSAYLGAADSKMADSISRFYLEHCDLCRIEYDEASHCPPPLPLSARSKAFSSFGFKRIVYDERRTLQHISCVVVKELFSSLVSGAGAYSAGFAQRKLPEWCLDDEHLLLEKSILKDYEYLPADQCWSDFLKNIIDECKGSKTPLADLELYCKDYDERIFRKLGVEEFYKQKEFEVEVHSLEIIRRVEAGLYRYCQDGILSLVEAKEACEEVMSLVEHKKEDFDILAKSMQEDISKLEQLQSENSCAWQSLNLFDTFLGKNHKLLRTHQEILGRLYVLRTKKRALHFALELLACLPPKLMQLYDRICTLTEVWQRWAADMEQGVTVEISDDEEIARIENTLINDEEKMDFLLSKLREMIYPSANLGFVSAGGYENTDTLMAMLEDHLRIALAEEEYITSGNVLSHLQKRLSSDQDIEQFACDMIRESSVCLQLNQSELHREIHNCHMSGCYPKTLCRNIMILLPATESGQLQFYFAEKLKEAFRRAVPANVGFYLCDNSGNGNEISVTTLLSLFPIRVLAILPVYEQKYMNLVQDQNSQRAASAKVMLHAEGDGTQFPPLNVTPLMPSS